MIPILAATVLALPDSSSALLPVRCDAGQYLRPVAQPLVDAWSPGPTHPSAAAPAASPQPESPVTLASAIPAHSRTVTSLVWAVRLAAASMPPVEHPAQPRAPG